MTSWTVQANPKFPRRVIFRGERYNRETREREPVLLRARIIRGRMTREVHAGFLGLNSPLHRQKLSADWTVTTPQRYGAHDNTGDNRRFLVLVGPRCPELTLHFDKPYPLGENGLAEALRIAFSRPGSRERQKEENRREEDPGQHVRPPEAEVVPKPRYRAYGREAPADREGERLYVQKVAERRRKASRKKAVATRKRNARLARKEARDAERGDRP